MSPQQAISEAVWRCTTNGTDWAVLNAYGDTVWNIEADTKVDADDLTYPAIVHMRGGAYAGTDDEAIVVLVQIEYDDA